MDMTTADPLVGATLDRRYFVESRIASGGMATVYVAHDLRLDRRLALKAMHPSLAQDPTFVRRFINEAHSVAKLSHPNVVQVFDQGTDQGYVYLAMEYVPGRTLRDLLNDCGRLLPRDALEIMSPVLAALAAAHQAGLVHRDVKPENVLITENGQVKVADFGLARAVESSQQAMTKTGTLMGTAAYLAPEQIEQGTSDARTDVYAAGIMLYELLTGAQPHTGENPIAIAYQHVNEDVPRPSRVLPTIPSSVDVLVTKATERDPQYRPGDAGRYLASVLDVMDSLPATGSAPLPATGTVAAAPLPADSGSGNDNDNDTLVVDLDGPEDAEERRPDGRPPWYRNYPLVLVAGVLAVALLGFGWWMLLGRYETVPDLVGMDQDTAGQVLRDSGLKMAVSEVEVYSDEAEEGQVAETSPTIDERILPDETVTVSLSKGPRTTDMPEVVGEPVENARKALADAGFSNIEEEEGSSSEEPIGTVLSSDPEPGDSADREGTVTLTVNSGFSVPDVVGKDQEAARSELEGKGLQVDVTEKPSDDVDKGTVMEQSPAAGENVGTGDSVALTVSSGPEEIEIPDVTGWKVKDAEKELKELGFKVKVTEVFGGDRVTSYSPQGKAEKGDEVELFVSPFAPGDRGNDRGNGRGNDRGDDRGNGRGNDRGNGRGNDRGDDD
ncbi:MAG: Stk1 family PASTA domain-containing Ser/Thr kinase [Nocardiopsaceae bacterium]|nr:Stk1 family PASTA domain-containing Ser/Thr kinase [Nocardiopsaceae bacterium]